LEATPRRVLCDMPAEVLDDVVEKVLTLIYPAPEEENAGQ
jgi:hypothetical protein